jgi:membrane protein DedA with SNARE-associated domain
MSTTTDYRDSWINPRVKIAALWASMLFVFVYVDLFSLYRADIRADIEAGKIFAFSIGQGFLLGVVVYIALPSLMVFLSLVLPVKATRMANLVLAVLYAVTIVGGAVGEWNYYILGSAIEAALLATIAYYAWTWPKAIDASAGVIRETTVRTS